MHGASEPSRLTVIVSENREMVAHLCLKEAAVNGYRRTATNERTKDKGNKRIDMHSLEKGGGFRHCAYYVHGTSDESEQLQRTSLPAEVRDGALTPRIEAKSHCSAAWFT